MNNNKIKKKRVKRTPEQIAAKKKADYNKLYSYSRFSHWAEHGDLEDGPYGYEDVPTALDELLTKYGQSMYFEDIGKFLFGVDRASKNFRKQYDFNVTEEVIIESFEDALESKPELEDERLCKYVHGIIKAKAEANSIPEPGTIIADSFRIVGAK